VGVQEVRWDREGAVIAGEYNFYMVKVMKILNWEQDSFYTTEYYQQLRE